MRFKRPKGIPYIETYDPSPIAMSPELQAAMYPPADEALQPLVPPEQSIPELDTMFTDKLMRGRTRDLSNKVTSKTHKPCSSWQCSTCTALFTSEAPTHAQALCTTEPVCQPTAVKVEHRAQSPPDCSTLRRLTRRGFDVEGGRPVDPVGSSCPEHTPVAKLEQFPNPTEELARRKEEMEQRAKVEVAELEKNLIGATEKRTVKKRPVVAKRRPAAVWVSKKPPLPKIGDEAIDYKSGRIYVDAKLKRWRVIRQRGV